MVYFLLYACIGMVYTGLKLPKAIAEVRQNAEDPKVKELAAIGCSIAGAFLIVPFWPMWITMDIVKMFRRKETHASSDA